MYDVMSPWTMFTGDLERSTDIDRHIVPKPGDREIIDAHRTQKEKGI